MNEASAERASSTNSIKKILFFISVFLPFLLCVSCEDKETFPSHSRKMSIVCPSPFGVRDDVMLRTLVYAIKKTSNITIDVKNISDNDGAKGVDSVLNAPADGYTLLFADPSIITTTDAGITEGYHNLDTICILSEQPLVLCAPKGRWKDFAAFTMDYDNSNMTVGTLHYGTNTFRVAKRLCKILDHMLTPISCADNTAIIKGIEEGRCSVGILPLADYLQDGNTGVEALVLLTKGHSSHSKMKNVPSIYDYGYNLEYPGFVFNSILVKQGTDMRIKSALLIIIKKAWNSSEFQHYLETYGNLKTFSGQETAEAYMEYLIKSYKDK